MTEVELRDQHGMEDPEFQLKRYRGQSGPGLLIKLHFCFYWSHSSLSLSGEDSLYEDVEVGVARLECVNMGGKRNDRIREREVYY